ncbi:PORR domain-containing protein [Heracleum sosnowskyi]|uniref:PORR domain-containing protein n=1 Tax=Heracleum sosnowskyi TaxID=360622 RepID=A0AAD8MFV3_9APIA|nr:PORR domain-containing protein [Heracleum sosnowskyi]
MKFPLFPLLKPSKFHQQTRSIFDSASPIKWVRDRALDHAVEKERNLKPLINLKNFIKQEPSKTSPISLILQNKLPLQLPFRPIEFIRKYPSVFEEFLPGDIGVNPHVKLTPEVVELDVEEEMVFSNGMHKQEVADRLLRLLMVGKINKIPLRIIDKLKWDLGLPNDYVDSIVPEFPDYFCVRESNGLMFLELVCWSDELAVSVMEKKAMSGREGYSKGMPIGFPLQYSRGFEIDKKFKKWVDDWQKLPYVSPYENGMSFQGKGDEFDKWAVGVLHEVLSLFVPKKTEKDNILLLGDYFGVRSRFKKALLEHPGIFYISSKLRTHTVVLRDAYKRDLLIGKHNPVMDMRSKYIHLMTTVKEESKSKSAQVGKTRRKKTSDDSKEGEEEVSKDDGNEEEEDENSSRVSDSEFEDESDDDDYEDESESESDDDYEDQSTMNRGRTTGKSNFQEKARPLRTEQKQFDRRHPSKTLDRESATHSRGKENPGRFERDESNRRHHSKNLDGQSPSHARGRRSPVRNERDESSGRHPGKTLDRQPPTFSGRREGNFRNERDESRRYPDKAPREKSSTFSGRRERPWRSDPDRAAKRHPGGTQDRQSRQNFRGEEATMTDKPNQTDRRYPSKTRDEQSPRYSRGKELPEHQNVRRRPHGRSDVSRTRKSKQDTY